MVIKSILISILVAFALPDTFETAKFLNEEDKKLCRVRAEINQRYNGKPDFDWKDVKKALADFKLETKSHWSSSKPRQTQSKSYEESR
ncbi:Uu.00g058730.m01.CDS01 [Anthostomella pinea]|uniref:Uu.00g058730.m01.CDS01 n=1 Tax=Anthostomella pinea TaxID=933095 RepID=A0AAI8VSS3_9PEZI|nr:Uu.00g058730.m01.CDS01 [Anthostomella pinea]